MKRVPLVVVVVLAAAWISGCRSISGPVNPTPPSAPDQDFAGGAAPKVADICETLMFPPQPPTAPAIKPAGTSVRVLAFGDYGDFGLKEKASKQKEVADAMKKQQFDFGITLGDNFYESGLSTATDARWTTDWEDMYGGMGIRLYASLGNHDYYDPKSHIAEALYSLRSKSWCFPASYYTYTAGPVQFFVLDTDWIMREWRKDRPDDKQKDPVKLQREWLREELDKSEAVWKVVYGHHPVYTTGEHQRDDPAMIDQILPVLKGRADVYLAGHDHDMQYLRPKDGVHFFVAGAAGHELRDLREPGDLRLWGKQQVPGFAVLEADAGSLTVTFFNTQNAELCAVKLVKGKPTTMSKGCEDTN